MAIEESISLNKYISSTGFCSRREADRLIEQGRVYINGRKAVKGNRVFPKDEVVFDGESIGKKTPHKVVLAFHKPKGITCTTDRRDKTNIIDFINYGQRVFPIGRLDKDSTGLILLTNDGELVNKVLREEYGHEKEYVVELNRPYTADFIQRMASGVPILGKMTKKCEVIPVNKTCFRIVLTQGLNRQIRRMCQYFGFRVKSLKRTRIMNLKLGKLKSGAWRILKNHELQSMEKMLQSSRRFPRDKGRKDPHRRPE